MGDVVGAVRFLVSDRASSSPARRSESAAELFGDTAPGASVELTLKFDFARGPRRRTSCTARHWRCAGGRTRPASTPFASSSTTAATTATPSPLVMCAAVAACTSRSASGRGPSSSPPRPGASGRGLRCHRPDQPGPARARRRGRLPPLGVRHVRPVPRRATFAGRGRHRSAEAGVDRRAVHLPGKAGTGRAPPPSPPSPAAGHGRLVTGGRPWSGTHRRRLRADVAGPTRRVRGRVRPPRPTGRTAPATAAGGPVPPHRTRRGTGVGRAGAPPAPRDAVVPGGGCRTRAGPRTTDQ